jgi:hypothetical protein
MTPPKVRPPPRRRTGNRRSLPSSARRGPAKRSSSPPASTQAASLSTSVSGRLPRSGSTRTRLRLFERSGGDQADGPAPPALVEQQHGAGLLLAFDRQPGDAVAQFGRQVERGLGHALSTLEGEWSAGHQVAVFGDGQHRGALFSDRPGAPQAQTERHAVGLGRQQQARQGAVAVAQHVELAQPLQPQGQGLYHAVGQAVRQPDHVGRSGQVEPFEGGQRRRSIDRPGFRRHALHPAAGLAGGQQAGNRGRLVQLAGRRGQQDHRPGFALGLGEQAVDRRFARLPVARGGPAVVDHEHQRAAAAQPGRGVQQRLGHSQDDQQGHYQPQQEQPPRGPRRRLLRRQEAEQQADGREAQGPRGRRRDPEQPPEQRQDEQRREYPRLSKCKRPEVQHRRQLSRVCDSAV